MKWLDPGQLTKKFLIKKLYQIGNEIFMFSKINKEYFEKCGIFTDLR